MEASDKYDSIPNGYIYNFIGNTTAVKVIAHISNGGYAQVYKVYYGLEKNIGCLKRVIVTNKQALNILRAEVDCMRILKDNSAHIVKYIDSNASRFEAEGKYEVLVLMELCDNGSLIDYMNTRLNNRFSEMEVFNIFDQTCRGIYAMHRLAPPLLHRDIKIENILINKSQQFKLCDFGSVCGIIRPPKNLEELNFVKNDLLSNTTAQYRPPEILKVAINNEINVKIDEKSDIWALGVYLYKLCYYTTPFEFDNSGNNGILSGNLKFPEFPKYSHNMKTLISWCLQVDSSKRPNICQLLEQTCSFEGKSCDLENFYKKRLLINQQSMSKIHQDQREFLKKEQLKQLQAFKQQEIMKSNSNIVDTNISKTTHAIFINKTNNSFDDEVNNIKKISKSKSFPSVTTSAVDTYNELQNIKLKNDKHEAEKQEDPFGDLVTIAKLEKHQYTSTADFEKSFVNGGLQKPISSEENGKSILTDPIFSNNSQSNNLKTDSNSVSHRLRNLISSDVEIHKSATGYGKYTQKDERRANSNVSTPPMKPPRPSISNSIAPVKPKKPEELKAPPKPEKPAALKAEKLIELDLKNFDKKYPQI